MSAQQQTITPTSDAELKESILLCSIFWRGNDDTLEFLRKFRPHGPWNLVALDPKGGLAKGGPAKCGATFGPRDEGTAREWLTGHLCTANLYYRVNPIEPGIASHNAKDEAVAEAMVLHTDIDPPDGLNHRDTQAVEDWRSQALERINAFPLRPSFCINSGAGFNLLWCLAESAPPSDAARVNKWLAEQLGGDKNCHNVSRLLRLPGTVNIPNASKRDRGRNAALAGVVWAEAERTYRLEDFPGAEAPRAPAASAEAPVALRRDLPSLEDVEQMLTHLTDVPEPDWLDVGMILRWEYGDGAYDVFDSWSREDAGGHYDPENNLKRWQSFATARSEGRRHQGIGTLFNKAKAAGWAPPADWKRSAAVDDFEVSKGERIGGGDVENGRRFAAEFRGKLRYVDADKSWRQWDGARWAHAPGTLMERFARETAERIFDECLNARRADWKNEWNKRALNLAEQTLRSNAKIAAIHEAGRSHEGMFVPDSGVFDADPWLLGVPNGTVDLRTGDLLAPDPKLMISKQAGIRYDLSATCPLWEKAIREIFMDDAELIGLFQRLCGYTLSGVADEEIIVFCYGKGHNGKSMVASVLTAILGEYACDIPPSALAARRDNASAAERALPAVQGKRLVFCNETKSGDVFDDAMLKVLASKDRIAARRLYGEFYSFDPTHTTWLRGNHKPGVMDDGEGFWRRMVLLPFLRKFSDAEKVPDLHSRVLAEEGAGVLRWMVEGCLAWQRDGRLILPKRIEDERAKYREESDLMGEWLNDRCEFRPDLRTKRQTAYDDYRHFLRNQGVSDPSQKTFSRQVESRCINGVQLKRTNEGRMILGLGLKALEAGEFETPR